MAGHATDSLVISTCAVDCESEAHSQFTEFLKGPIVTLTSYVEK